MFCVPEGFHRRRSKADNLDIVAEPIHHAETNVQINHRRDAQGTHFYAAFWQLTHPVEEALGEDMAEDIDLHEALFREIET